MGQRMGDEGQSGREDILSLGVAGLIFFQQKVLVSLFGRAAVPMTGDPHRTERQHVCPRVDKRVRVCVCAWEILCHAPFHFLVPLVWRPPDRTEAIHQRRAAL